MKKIFAGTFLSLITLFPAGAQSVVEVVVPQNPLFEVSTNVVNTGFNDSSATLTIGGNIVVKGGSGTYTYRWYTPSGNELGTDRTLTVDAVGKYLLDISDSCDCMQTIEFNVETNSVGTVEDRTVTVTPNPTSGYVEFTGFEAAQLTATNMAGQLSLLIDGDGRVFSSANLSALAPGAYILILTDSEGKTFSSKIIRK